VVSVSRLKLTAGIMHSEFGRAGYYTNCFVDQVLNQGLLEDIIEENKVKGWIPPFVENDSNFSDYSFRLHGDSTKIYWLKTSKNLKAISKFGINDFGLNMLTGDILNRALNKAFPDYYCNALGISKFQMKLAGKPAKEHKKCARRAFAKAASKHYEQAHSFIENPKVLINEAIITMQQVTRWVCMHARNPDEVVRQLEALFEDTVKDPRINRMISPLEMLGFGNNGNIGGLIDANFPTHMNVPIIRNAWETEGSIFSDEFIEFWFDQDLKIGGCPALTGKKRSGNAFENFAKMYVECVKRIKGHKDSFGLPPENRALKVRLEALRAENENHDKGCESPQTGMFRKTDLGGPSP
jgi:hypothetical protein